MGHLKEHGVLETCNTEIRKELWAELTDPTTSGLLYFFGYKTVFFPFQNNPKG